jgi:tRNA nucleotidyltransferase (CCA-adding enzyme)
LSASTLFELLQHFDIYRRPERFEQFIAACEMNARGRKGFEQTAYPQAAYLRGAAAAARAVAVQPLLELGYRGPELGEALKRERLKAVTQYQQDMHGD